MTLTTIGRWTLAFSLEAMLLASVFMLFGWMSADLSRFLSFSVVAVLLFILGGWLFHEGSRHSLFPLLLYALVGGVGLLGFLTFHSWLIALTVAGVYFWRIYSIASAGISHANLQRRFVLTLVLVLLQLTLAALYGSAVPFASFDPVPYYWMLGLALGCYLLVGSLEYVTREQTASARPPGAIRLKLGAQVLAAHAVLTMGYLLVASVILGALGFLWAWLKGPLGSGLYWLAKPVLAKLEEWMEGLSGVLESDRRVNELMNNQGQGGDLSYLPEERGEPLLSLLEPYLIAAAVLIFLLVLGRYLWKRRYRKADQMRQAVPAAEPTTWAPLPESADEDGRPLWDVRRWFQKPSGPADDPVRFAYYQFLKHMAAQGKPIYRFETSQEFVNRLQEQRQDPVSLELAAKITGYYELYRYREQPLAPDELAAMQQAVKSLRELPPA